MLQKAGWILIIYCVIGLVYVLMMTFQPFTNSVVATVNASVNWTEFPETQALMVGWPFWSYFVPASIGLVLTVMILRDKEI